MRNDIYKIAKPGKDTLFFLQKNGAIHLRHIKSGIFMKFAQFTNSDFINDVVFRDFDNYIMSLGMGGLLEITNHTTKIRHLEDSYAGCVFGLSNPHEFLVSGYSSLFVYNTKDMKTKDVIFEGSHHTHSIKAATQTSQILKT